MTHMMNIAYVDKIDSTLAKQIAKKWQFNYIGDIASISDSITAGFILQVNQQRLEVRKLDELKLGAVYVDFVDGASAHRRKFGGGRGQDIAKAVGLKHGFSPNVLDATAGLGRDSFVLATLGCQVTMLERVPVVAALLEDGLARASLSIEIKRIIANMRVIHSSLLAKELPIENPDVVYLDPMYPHRIKSAAVKKEMRVFQSLVGEDADADDLLAPALKLAKYRVVVKRPNYAPPLANIAPSTSIHMKKNRFDVYVNQAIPKKK